MNNEEDKTYPSPSDEAVYQVATTYMQRKLQDGISVVSGVSTNDIRDILQLYIDWCYANGYIEEGRLVIGLE